VVGLMDAEMYRGVFWESRIIVFMEPILLGFGV